MSVIITVFFIYLFIGIIYKTAASQTQALENILRNRNFINIQRLSMYDINGKTFVRAFANSMQYLFVKSINNSPIGMLSHKELQNIQTLAKDLRCDRVILFVNQSIIPIELTKITALYNIEIWNKDGESNFDLYRITKPATTSSRLAKTLKPENAVYEHRKNGVIAADTCHIAPSVSPIQENPTKLLKRKGPQRL